MDTISLFSGCGGMDFGAERAGASIALASDVMAVAAQTYEQSFPGVTFLPGDIRSINDDGYVYPNADLVIGGYPCQSFSLGGPRSPAGDERTYLYQEYARVVDRVNPRFFVAENVKGLRSIAKGKWFNDQVELFSGLGEEGYNLSWALLNAADYGVPQLRKRVFVVGVRKDLGNYYWFPPPTHAKADTAERLGMKPFTSHGDCIADLPLWPEGEFYERPHDPDGHWAWYYMSRNRKARWDAPSYTVLANWRHTTLHPASETMALTWSNLADGFKQRWDFSGEYEHVEGHPERPTLDQPRRLSWRECARIQTFPSDFEPAGNVEQKFEQIGNAVPPMLAEAVLAPLLSQTNLRPSAPAWGEVGPIPD